MARSRGANAISAMAINTGVYGDVPNAGWVKLAFAAHNLGEEQALIESDLLGYGRAPLDPSQDVINNDGDQRVPVDLRMFGYWLYLAFGPPTTTPGLSATGLMTFTAQPAANATITLAGQAFTFVAGVPGANQIKIGANLVETVENAVFKLNGSAVAAVAAATYLAGSNGRSIEIEHDTPGVGGNAFTLAASNDANVTLSGATLAGGAAAGGFRNVFEAGAAELPDACIENGYPEVPDYEVNFGVMVNTIAIDVARSGHLSALMGLIAQGSDTKSVSSAGVPEELALERFSQFSGNISRGGIPLGDVVSGTFNFSNGLDKVEVIRRDGRIAGADPGIMSATPSIVMRFKERALLEIARNGEPIDITWAWRISAAKQLRFTLHSVYLPRPRRPVSGPGGVQVTFNCQASQKFGTGRFLTATLINDMDLSALAA